MNTTYVCIVMILFLVKITEANCKLNYCSSFCKQLSILSTSYFSHNASVCCKHVIYLFYNDKNTITKFYNLHKPFSFAPTCVRVLLMPQETGLPRGKPPYDLVTWLSHMLTTGGLKDT